MQLSLKVVLTLIVLLVLWILWCFFVIDDLMPHIELHFAVWHSLMSWVLCVLPVAAVATVLAWRVKKGK